MCFLGPSTLFSLPAAGLSLCSRPRGTQAARPDKVGALVEVR